MRDYSRKSEPDDGYYQQKQPKGWKCVERNLMMQSCISDRGWTVLKGTHPEHSVMSSL